MEQIQALEATVSSLEEHVDLLTSKPPAELRAKVGADHLLCLSISPIPFALMILHLVRVPDADKSDVDNRVF